MFRLRSFAALVAWSVAVAGSNSPDEFSQARAMVHIRSLAALRNRTAGTSGESRAIRYVREQLRHTGLDVWEEPFLFRSYELIRATLRVGDISVEATRVAFDPYSGATDIQGDLALVPALAANNDTGLANLDLAQRVVVTTKEARYYRIAAKEPAAIVFLSDHDFEQLKRAGARRAELLLNGRVRTMRSANLIAVTKNRTTGHEIIVSAHIDSAGTPGAQDNASGIAVLLELARTLPKLHLPFRLRFVFFGAEEVGLLGSQAYVDRHREDLRQCELVFNMDCVGGKEIFIDMRDGVRNLPGLRGDGQVQPRENLAKAHDDFKGRWMSISSTAIAPDSSNVPPWLQNAILDSVRELGYQITPSRGADSDHRTFTNAGIVATDIATSGLKTHSPEDLPDQIVPLSLEKVARIVTGVVARSVATLDAPQPIREVHAAKR
jgi:hypothetical protein